MYCRITVWNCRYHIVFAPKYRSNRIRIVMDGTIECARTCIENDIPVGLGNDVGCLFVLHYNFWKELCYFHRYTGISIRDTLYTATLGNAKILGIDSETGNTEPGKCADMIVVPRDPVADLTVLKDVSMVIARGKLFKHPSVKKIDEVDDLLDKYI